MRYVQNTPDDQREMLATIGVRSLDDLFRNVPPELLKQAAASERDRAFPERLCEADLLRHMEELAARNRPLGAGPSFLGAGCYRHYIPPVVDALASRGEFLTAYTPYQPEASQGSLQAFFEFQSLVCELVGLDVANASQYDGATALAEGLLMVHATGRGGRGAKVLLSEGIHPHSIATVRTYYANLPYEVETVPLGRDGLTDAAALDAALEGAGPGPTVAAVAFQSPTFLGTIEDGAALARAAKAKGAVPIQVVNPIALALLAPPGETGVDVAVGDLQPCGIPPQLGGPHCGLLAARAEYIRKLPGRLVGQTVDQEGKVGYVLTLQTREQHIRRERATSNICTNVGLMALRATIYLSTLGREGLKKVAAVCVERAHYAAARVASLAGFALKYRDTPFFHEFVVACQRPAREVNARLRERGIAGGLAHEDDPKAMLLCVTEMTSIDDIERLVAALKEAR